MGSCLAGPSGPSLELRMEPGGRVVADLQDPYVGEPVIYKGPDQEPLKSSDVGGQYEHLALLKEQEALASGARRLRKNGEPGKIIEVGRDGYVKVKFDDPLVEDSSLSLLALERPEVQGRENCHRLLLDGLEGDKPDKVSAAVQGGTTPDLAFPGAYKFGSGLHVAAHRNRPKALRALIEAKANVDYTDDDGRTALQVAAAHPSDCLDILLKAGANPNIADKKGATPLSEARRMCDDEAVEFLVKAGATA